MFNLKLKLKFGWLEISNYNTGLLPQEPAVPLPGALIGVYSGGGILPAPPPQAQSTMGALRILNQEGGGQSWFITSRTRLPSPRGVQRILVRGHTACGPPPIHNGRSKKIIRPGWGGQYKIITPITRRPPHTGASKGKGGHIAFALLVCVPKGGGARQV